MTHFDKHFWQVLHPPATIGGEHPAIGDTAEQRIPASGDTVNPWFTPDGGRAMKLDWNWSDRKPLGAVEASKLSADQTNPLFTSNAEFTLKLDRWKTDNAGKTVTAIKSPKLHSDDRVFDELLEPAQVIELGTNQQLNAARYLDLRAIEHERDSSFPESRPSEPRIYTQCFRCGFTSTAQYDRCPGCGKRLRLTIPNFGWVGRVIEFLFIAFGLVITVLTIIGWLLS
jgi:hypothetical protein